MFKLLFVVAVATASPFAPSVNTTSKLACFCGQTCASTCAHSKDPTCCCATCNVAACQTCPGASPAPGPGPAPRPGPAPGPAPISVARQRYFSDSSCSTETQVINRTSDQCFQYHGTVAGEDICNFDTVRCNNSQATTTP